MTTYQPHPTLDLMLWSGFSNYATKKLEQLGRSSKPRERYQSAWGLMRKCASDGDYERAIHYLSIAKEVSPANAGGIHFILLEMDILRNLGRIEEAQHVGFKARSRFGEDPRINVALSSLFDDIDRRLNLLSRPLAASGFARIVRRDPNLPLTIHNLTAAAKPINEGPTVSVIMPAFNAAGTIETAIRGILEQSWRNLELIIVDDASDDDTWDVINQIAAADDRVKTIRQAANGGVYRARNTGLAAATGAYVTVNDSDDWSHPQRIEAQMREISEEQPFNTTFGIRSTETLFGAVRYRNGTCIVENTSSLLVPTQMVKDLGGWDEVRFSADSDLYFRLMQTTGKKESKLLRFVPFAFILSLPESLTNGGATSLKSLHYGARREYKEASAHWRNMARSIVVNAGERPYPTPRITVDKSDAPIEIEYLLVADMTREASGSFLAAAHRRGPTGVLHIPAPDNFGKDFAQSARSFIHDNRVEVIVPGQSVTCDTILIPDVRCLEALPDALPATVAKTCIVAGNVDVTAFGADRVVRVERPDIDMIGDVVAESGASALREGREMGYDDASLSVAVYQAMCRADQRNVSDMTKPEKPTPPKSKTPAFIRNKNAYAEAKPEIAALAAEIQELERKRDARRARAS